MKNKGKGGTPYNSYVLHMLVKILTNLDRDPDSPTYGSFDRNYWNYKIRDFSSSLLQQSALTLALAYTTPFAGNRYYKQAQIKEYALAGIRYCAKLQQRDGSFPEYWANERSIPSTAFTLAALSEACDLLGYVDDNLKRTARKAARFLLRHVEDGALNQEMAATAAVAGAAKLLKDKGLAQAARQKFGALLRQQSKEGWFAEYGGVDIGYLTVCLDFLVRYYDLTKEKRALVAAREIVKFLQYFIHPDGTLGGEYCTRNTEYFLPFGIERMKRHEPVAESILRRLMGNIDCEYLNSCIDERYLLHYVGTSFLKAIAEYRNVSKGPRLPCDASFEKYFDDGMLYVKSTSRYYFVCSLMKGGVFKVFDRRKKIMSTDCTYRLTGPGKRRKKQEGKLFVTGREKLLVSEWPKRNEHLVKEEKGMVRVTTGFSRRGFLVQTPIKQTILKFSSLLLGRLPVVVSKRLLIYGGKKDKSLPRFTRELEFSNDAIAVKDTFDFGRKMYRAQRMRALSLRHTASSRFFQANTVGNKVPAASFTASGRKKASYTLRF